MKLAFLCTIATIGAVFLMSGCTGESKNSANEQDNEILLKWKFEGDAKTLSKTEKKEDYRRYNYGCDNPGKRSMVTKYDSRLKVGDQFIERRYAKEQSGSYTQSLTNRIRIEAVSEVEITKENTANLVQSNNIEPFAFTYKNKCELNFADDGVGESCDLIGEPTTKAGNRVYTICRLDTSNSDKNNEVETIEGTYISPDGVRNENAFQTTLVRYGKIVCEKKDVSGKIVETKDLGKGKVVEMNVFLKDLVALSNDYCGGTNTIQHEIFYNEANEIITNRATLTDGPRRNP